MFHERYTDYFTVNFTEMLTHARAIGTRPLFLLLLRPGYEATPEEECHFTVERISHDTGKNQAETVHSVV